LFGFRLHPVRRESVERLLEPRLSQTPQQSQPFAELRLRQPEASIAEFVLTHVVSGRARAKQNPAGWINGT
jgi:hypothetical protein